MFWQCVKCSKDVNSEDYGNATELETQKITANDLVEMKREEMKEQDSWDLPIAIREQLEEENANRYLRLRLVNDYAQLMEWQTVFQNEGKDNNNNIEDDLFNGVIRLDFNIENVVERNPQYARVMAEVIQNRNEDSELTTMELIKKYPQIELSMAGIVNP